jgi:hypothetical protein
MDQDDLRASSSNSDDDATEGSHSSMPYYTYEEAELGGSFNNQVDENDDENDPDYFEEYENEDVGEADVADEDDESNDEYHGICPSPLISSTCCLISTNFVRQSKMLKSMR